MTLGSMSTLCMRDILAHSARCALPALGLLCMIVSPSPTTGASPAAPHWAFEPLGAPEPPRVRNASWAQVPIDRFILQKLEAAGLPPAEPASRETIIRRVAFGLTGLPPTPEEVEDFMNDPSPRSYERLLDRLLESPHYGERWARHWLDLARYAESDGFEHDAVRPHSWRFRDYVIRAFNEDKPYDRFIREQLAGDELWPDDPEALIATGFNLLGPDMVDSADPVQRRLNLLNDMTDTAASAFLGLTLGCARCHDHKFEPLTQQDYFSLQAFFAPAEAHRDHPVPSAADRVAHDSAMAEYQAQAQGELKLMQALEGPYRQQLLDKKLSKLSEDARIAHQTPKALRTLEQEGTVQETAKQVDVTEAEIVAALSREDRIRRDEVQARLKRFAKPGALPAAMVLLRAKGPAPRTHVLARGDYNEPLEEVMPGFPAVLQSPGRGGSATRSAPAAPSDAAASSNILPEVLQRRTALAEWVASPRNPLTARVLVNRLWQHHFGRGLLSTPNDFGTRGSPPSHPELLDWLATELIRGGWRIKTMQKLILMSAAFQQSTLGATDALAKDPENRLFSRQNRVRLEGEAIRDSLLAVSGRLNRRMGGPAVSPPISAEITSVAKNWTTSTDPEDPGRRSIYILSRRNLRFPFLEVFDAPDSNLSCPERGRSTTAQQSLTLLNSDEVMAAATAAADRLLKEGRTDEERVQRTYRLILSRAPSTREAGLAREFLRAAPLAELCRALFNLNSFVYVE